MSRCQTPRSHVAQLGTCAQCAQPPAAHADDIATAAFLDEVAAHAYGWPASLRFTYDTARRLLAEGIQGAFVECGVGAGVHPAAVGRACLDAGEHRSIRLFDSFQGVPNGGAHDATWNASWGDGSGTLQATGVSAHSLADVQANLQRWGLDGSMFEFYVGWFQETLPPVAEAWARARANGDAEGIAFLRLDGDLYESTLVCLEWLYPLVVSGGVIVVDDYNLDGCRAAMRAYFNDMGAGYGAGPMRPIPQVQEITESGDVWWAKA